MGEMFFQLLDSLQISNDLGKLTLSVLKGAKWLQEIHVEQKFDTGKFSMWLDQKGGMVSWARHMQTSSDPTTAEKIEKINLFHHQNKKCEGTMTRLQFRNVTYKADTVAVEAEPELMRDIEEMMTDEGAWPWLASATKHKWRIEPLHWGPTGFACFAQAMTAPIALMSFPIAQLLTLGISLPDMGAFLGQPEGVNFLKNHGIPLFLPVGALAYIPAGYVTFPLYTDLAKKD